MSEVKVWTKDEVKALLESNDEMVKHSLLVLYALQTYDEQCSESTSHQNGVGFGGLDAEILSSFSKQLKEKKFLSPKQLAIARRKLAKYSGQLVRVANGDLEVSEKDILYK